MKKSFVNILQRIRLLRLLTGILLMWLLFVCGLTLFIYGFGTTDQATDADVIVILGAGLKESGRAGPALTRRSHQGADLWEQGIASHLICTGAQAQGYPRSEAAACQEILLQLGVPANSIILEDRSRSTEENAFYTSEIMQEKGWQSAVVVSDSYHVLRAQWLFNRYEVTVYTSPVAARQVDFMTYGYSMIREIAAMHWQAFKDFFNLPVSYVYGL